MAPVSPESGPPLPIDPLLPGIVSAVRERGAVVVEAPPGAGKTTRVPLALLHAGIAGEGELLVLEPRRIAARTAARRVASSLGEEAGETVGYQVRYEELCGPRTRLKFVTEGVLVRRLATDPSLSGVGAVVLDEFHERHIHADLALALLRRLKETSRPDLALAVMSATLDAAPVAAWLGAPVVRSEGRQFDVSVEYLEPAEASDPRARLEDRVAGAVRRLAAGGTDGDILVFLPGMAEIRRSMAACAAFAASAGLDLLPLHGDLSPAEQDRALLPGNRPRAIFSTNVAETSVTIEGVTAVVDTGLARVSSHSPWSGIPRLETRKISRASAAQRAGRAGRTRPGRVARLYTRFDHDMRPAFDLPEILREDLAEALLLTASLGATEMSWLDPPPKAALEAAAALLVRLGALEGDWTVTEAGRNLLRYPLHPRLARLAVEAKARGAGMEGALVAALISERDIREREEGAPGRLVSGSSDLVELATRYAEAERGGFPSDRLRSLGLSAPAVSAVTRAYRQIAAVSGEGRRFGRLGDRVSDREEAIRFATLAAFSDRLGRRREAGSDEVVLSGGGSARIAPWSVVRDAPLLVAVDVEERRGAAGRGASAGGGGASVRLASAVSPEMLLELFPDRLEWKETLSWNESAERVDGWEVLSFDGLALETARKPSVDPGKASSILAERAIAKGARAFAAEGEIDRFLSRVAFVSRSFPESGIAPPNEEALSEALARACEGRRSFSELREAGIAGVLRAMLPGDRRAFLDRMAPERIPLPGGRSLAVHYGKDGTAPHVESRLQDFFGEKAGPTIGGGRVPLVVHLLAPNRRAVQVTSDLTGFWQRHYPSIRKELMRRYPKHAWPENPLEAPPPRRSR